MLRKGLLGAGAIVATGAALATSAGAHSTTDHTIVGDGSAGYEQLTDTGPAWERVVREDLAAAAAGRETRRTSLLYFGQLTDFQISDEESPARVEFFDVDAATAPAWRPQEAVVAHMVDQAIRAVNAMATSPHEQAGGARAQLGLSLITGDQADSQQKNEVEWVVRLLEGGEITPNSGVEDGLPACGKDGEAAGYTGVQDYDDYADVTDSFYDPDDPRGKWSAFPTYPGLMDRAQRGFTAAGSDVPTYVTNGNHDALVQGNAWANAGYEAVATGCAKHAAPAPLVDTSPSFNQLSPEFLATHPEQTIDVPRDPERRYVDKREIRKLYDTGHQPDAHGYAFVSQEELEASNGAASYYSFLRNGIRFISIDTVSEAGIPMVSDKGNIDDPQFRWLAREIAAAENRNELIVLFGHHPIRSLTANAPDELAPPCAQVNAGELGGLAVTDPHGHDVNPGCDLDPRPSGPVRLGADLEALLLAHPHVIAYVSGHTHDHNVEAFERPDGSGGFYGIETSSIVDWPVQARLIELMDNQDGTLSFFSTIIDHAGPVTAAAPGTEAHTLEAPDLAAIGRTLAYNDPQAGEGTGIGNGAGDRNVELLLPDPR